MLDLPAHIPLVFILTTLATYIIFIFAMLNSKDERVKKRANFIAVVMLLWLIFQSTLSLNKWYMDRTSVPPHLAFPLITSIVVIVLLFILKRGKKLLDGLSLETLTWLHTVRIPVELCLLWLAMHKQVPFSMTFEGYNFDIAFGLTAPIMAILYFRKKKISRSILLGWNVLALISVVAVVIRAIGAVPSPIQAWDFAQPNYAVLHFPFIWLPAFVVPAVVLAHLVAFRQLRRKTV